jgi:hypothetical protein
METMLTIDTLLALCLPLLVGIAVWLWSMRPQQPPLKATLFETVSAIRGSH